MTHPDEPEFHAAKPSRAHVGLCAAIALCFWIRNWRFPDAAASPIPDPSWLQSLGYALLHRMQFGTQIAYTYGPLGWFNGTPHQDGLYAFACYGWELGLKLAVAVFLGLAGLQLRSIFALIAFAFVLIVPEMGNDGFFFVAITAISAWAIPRAPRHWGWMVAPLFVLVVIALDKFTYTLLALAAVVCIAVASGRLAKALGIAGMFALLFVAAWWALGQSPANLPAWFVNSVGQTAGYSTAQSVAPWPRLLVAAIVVLALGTSTVVWRLRLDRGSARAERRPLLALSIMWLAGLVLSYKAGFTRASGNEICMFAFASSAVFLLPRASLRSPRAVVFSALRTATCLAAVVGYCLAADAYGRAPRTFVPAAARQIAQNLSTVLRLREHEAMRIEERIGLAQKYALPHLKRLVGDSTIDVFGAEQAFVFLNDMNWHPRPYFQGFCVMTDAMSAVNERFLSGPDAPRFVLYLPDSIDYRLPGMEDARSLATVVRDYRAVGRERGLVLFERRADAPRADRRELVVERALEPGETLDLSQFAGDVLELEVESHLDLGGRLRALALGAPLLWLETETDDGTARSYRVLPAMLAYGSIVRPWLQSPGDWVRFLVGEPVHALKSVRFAADSSGWSTPFVVRVWRANDLRPDVDARTDETLRWSMFDPIPDRFDSPTPADPTVLRGYLDALVVQAPSALIWHLAPGAYRLHAQYGFLPNAWRDGPTDGAIARVEVHRASGERNVLFERTLDPKRHPLDSKLMMLDIDVRVEPGDDVKLTTDPGPAGDAERDLLFWTDVAFTPAR